MSQADFIASLEQELRFRGLEYDRRDLLDFATSVWPMAEEDPDAGRWAREFLGSMAGSVGG